MPFIRPVNSTSAPATIKAVKGIISENGIPYKIISDNHPFNSYEFKEFAKRYGFEVVSSSPEYPRGHGLIERHVQTVKKCMYKCDHSGQDIELALLSLRSTPLDSHLPSPAELLNGRKYRTTLPSINRNCSYNNEDIRGQLKTRQQISKKYYDEHSHDKSELTENQPVRIRNQETKRWEPAYVIKKAETPRSFIIQRCAGGVPLRRNRQHIRNTREQWCAGEVIDKDQSYDVDFYTDSQLKSDREMVDSETSLRTSVCPRNSQETVGSERSLRSAASSADTREMVGSEPSLRSAMSDDVGHNTSTSDNSSHVTAPSGHRYPKRKRNSPDYYQAGT